MAWVPETIVLCPSGVIIWHRPAASLSVGTSPSHRFKHRNFTFGIHMHLCPSHMHIKYLTILTCSFSMVAILVLFSDWYSAHVDNHRDFILHILMHLFFTYICKRNDATVTFFSKIYEHFLKIHLLVTLHWTQMANFSNG